MRRIKRLFLLGSLGCLLAAAFAAPPASADFGLKNLDFTFTGADGSPAMQAGSHPFQTTLNLDVNTEPGPKGAEVPSGALKDLSIELPPGLVGDPTAMPRCPLTTFFEMSTLATSCPNDTAVGFTELSIGTGDELPEPLSESVYNLETVPGEPLRLGFVAVGVPVTIDFHLKTSPPYNAIASITNASQVEKFYHARTFIWGTPADPAHDSQRGTCLGAGGSCPVATAPRPLLLMPRSCQGPLTTTFLADSWQNPGAFLPFSIETHDNSVPPNPLGIGGCAKLGFVPHITAQPTSDQAESPSGLDFHLDINDEGITSQTGLAQSDIKKAVVTLPEGVTINPSVAEGLVTCTPGDLKGETLAAEPGEGCPQASKVGSVEVETPLLEGKLLRGSIFATE